MANDAENRIQPKGPDWFERSLTSSNLSTALNPPPPPVAEAPPPPPPAQGGK